LQYEDDLINKIYCNEIIVIMQNILSNDYTNKNQYDIINTYINNPYISQKSIALKMGVSQSWVSYVLKKFKQKVCNKLVS
jgi:DNA-binding MarR family transcriptional regulator